MLTRNEPGDRQLRFRLVLKRTAYPIVRYTLQDALSRFSSPGEPLKYRCKPTHSVKCVRRRRKTRTGTSAAVALGGEIILRQTTSIASELMPGSRSAVPCKFCRPDTFLQFHDATWPGSTARQMIEELAKRRALRLMNKTRKALAASAKATPSSSSSSSLPKPVQLPVTKLPGHSKPTLPSINRLLGRPIQIPPPRKKNKWKDSEGKPNPKEGFGRRHARLPVVGLNYSASQGKGKQAAREEETLADSLKSHVARSHGPSSALAQENVGSTTWKTLEGTGSESPARQLADMMNGHIAAASGLSTGWVKEDWFSEPWERGARFVH